MYVVRTQRTLWMTNVRNVYRKNEKRNMPKYKRNHNQRRAVYVWNVRGARLTYVTQTKRTSHMFNVHSKHTCAKYK